MTHTNDLGGHNVVDDRAAAGCVRRRAAAPPAFCATYIALDTELLANAKPYISGMTQYQHCGIEAAFADV